MWRTCGNTQEFFVCSLSRLKPGLYIVVTIKENAHDNIVVTIKENDHALNRVLKPLIYHSQTFLLKYKHLSSLQLCENQDIPGLRLQFLLLIWRQGLSPVVNRNRRKDGGGQH